MLRQVIDALSPANALMTNPEALRIAVESGGASLADGMQLFMQDFAKGRVSMSDDTAFEVGRKCRDHTRQRGVRERADAARPVRADHHARSSAGTTTSSTA